MGQISERQEKPFLAFNMEELRRLQEFLSERWPQGLPHNQCNRTAYVVQKLFGGFVAGGWPRDDHTKQIINKGYCTSIGKWRQHYWNVIGNYIVDLTVGQFDESGICTDKDDSRYRAAVIGLPDEMEDFVDARTGIAAEWLAEYMKFRKKE